MKQNSLILVTIIVLCAAVLGWFGSQDRGTATVPANLPKTEPINKDRKALLVEDIVQQKPQSANELSYVLEFKGNQVEFKLTNNGRSTHLFFGDSLEIRGLGVPGHADVQVLNEDGSLFEAWDSQIHVDSWSPLLSSSYAKSTIPAKSRAIKPGETRSLLVPIENFFSRSNFDPKAENYRVRVVSNLYLDANLTQYIESRTDWIPLRTDPMRTPSQS